MIRYWTELVEQNPDDKIFLFILASLELKEYNYFTSKRYLDHLESLEVDNSDVQILRALNVYFEGSKGGGTKILRKLVKNHPERYQQKSAIIMMQQQNGLSYMKKIREIHLLPIN
jgi:hypothetical protein